MRQIIAVIFTVAILAPVLIDAQTIKSKEQLEQELKALEAEIASINQDIGQKQKEGASLTRDITLLNQKIKQSQLLIKEHDAAVAKLNQSIGEKNKNINSLNDKMGREKDSLAQILRKTDYMGNYSVMDFAAQNNTLSSFFADIDSFATIDKALQQSFQEIRSTKNEIEGVKQQLESDKEKQLAEKQQQEIEKKKVESNQRDKQSLLTVTKGQEKEYQKLLADRQKQAAQIRSALFELTGSKSINFGQAYDLALKAQKATGIRPAFLLGLITVESNLGQNVGKGNWLVDMHPTRDQPIFQQITSELGLDPNQMPVSKKQWYGYGGAMGPAQFIPSTWVLYKAKISSLTGHTPPNPWNPEDAFMGAALLLSESGGVGGRSAEFHAAMCYLAGCGNASKASLQFYGQNVLKYADDYESKIKVLQGQ